ncbi:MAG: alpha/beta hydrolase [Propionibacteriales bacterium]|nr:alpha/beta hydrolase [Propionibacteriales bacterium]
MADSDASHRRLRLRRDGQQWNYDRAVKDTGRVFHFQHAGRGKIPESVKMHAMISKHLGKKAQKLEQIAKAEADAGHDVTAIEFYFDAAVAYANAQHTVFAVNAEKKYLHGSVLRCYDEIRRLSPTTIEHVDVPWEGTVVSGNLHLAPVDGPAPLIFFIPGCDMTKEMVPHPLYNFANQRGMHLFVFDGPGQGESNLRGIKITQDNYEHAASTALTQLVERPDVDESKVGLYSLSFGSYWGARFAATDDRIAASAMVWASICDKYHLFEEESPRYKQLFAFLTGLGTEAELDEFMAGMGLEDLLPRITAPTLATVGEYDPRSPIDEVYELFDLIRAPAQLWVFADQHHGANVRGSDANQWYADHHSMAADWLRERLDGKPIDSPGETLYIEPASISPNDPRVSKRRQWFGS